MPRLPHTYLYRLQIGDKVLPLVVNARSQTAARDHFIDKHLKIERMTTEEAFRAGVEGAIVETAGLTLTAAEAPSSSTEPELFDRPGNEGEATPAQAPDATSRPIDHCGAGYAAAVAEASTL
jgi:hypothetical protein